MSSAAATESKANTHQKLLLFDLIIRDRTLTAMDLRVAWRILDRVNEKRAKDPFKSWPGMRKIAVELGAAVSSVHKSVNRLHAAGWIAVEKSPGRLNRYTLAVEKVLVPTRTPSVEGVRFSSRGVSAHANGVLVPTLTEPTKEPTYKNLEKTLSQRLEEKRSSRKKSVESATNNTETHAVPSLVSNVGGAPARTQSGGWKGLAAVLPKITTGAPPPAVRISSMPRAAATAKALLDIASMRTALTTAALAMRRQGAGLAA